jgi:hypothetical protein
MTQRQRIIQHLTWMIEQLNWQNDQTGLEQQDSPELADAKELLAELIEEENAAEHRSGLVYCQCDDCRRLRGQG